MQTSAEMPAALKKIVGAFQMVCITTAHCMLPKTTALLATYARFIDLCLVWFANLEGGEWQKGLWLLPQVPDPMARYKQLLFFASKLDPLAAEYHTPEYRVPGCVSQVAERCAPAVYTILHCVGHSVLLSHHVCVR